MFYKAPSTRITEYQQRPKPLLFNRRFHKTNNSFAPNDLELLIEKVKDMEEAWNELDRDIEEVTKTIQQDDLDNRISDDIDDVSELHKYLEQRQNEKDQIVSRLEEARSSAILEDRERDIRLGSLDIMHATTTRDIETLREVSKELTALENSYEEVASLLERLEDLEPRVAELKDEFHENDLPPILGTQSDSETSKSGTSDTFDNQNNQEGSLLDDYADSSTEMPSYMDPDD
jgi:DNA repair exonuclease SbcCD ATPase subunit